MAHFIAIIIYIDRIYYLRNARDVSVREYLIDFPSSIGNCREDKNQILRDVHTIPYIPVNGTGNVNNQTHDNCNQQHAILSPSLAVLREYVSKPLTLLICHSALKQNRLYKSRGTAQSFESLISSLIKLFRATAQ